MKDNSEALPIKESTSQLADGLAAFSDGKSMKRLRHSVLVSLCELKVTPKEDFATLSKEELLTKLHTAVSFLAYLERFLLTASHSV
jgi:hypothetical protein